MSIYNENIKSEALIGIRVIDASINEEKTVIRLLTDKAEKYFLSIVGDCCTKSYLADINGSKNLDNSIIISLEEKAYITGKYTDYEQIDSFGLTIKTSKGYIDLSCRAEHNGYYSGYVLFSKEFPIDQYCGLDDPFYKYLELKDF